LTTPEGTREKSKAEQVKYEDDEEKENAKSKGQKRSTQVYTPEFEVLCLYIEFLLGI